MYKVEHDDDDDDDDDDDLSFFVLFRNVKICT
jgi:hypothetical protein